MATALPPQTDVTSGEAYRKKNVIKNPMKIFLNFFISLNLKLVTYLSIILMVILHT